MRCLDFSRDCNMHKHLPVATRNHKCSRDCRLRYKHYFSRGLENFKALGFRVKNFKAP